LKNKQQINTDERRFVDLDSQCFEVYQIEYHGKSPQSSEISTTAYETAQLNQNNRKLFRQISAFICVHLRLISVSLRDRARKIQLKLFPIQEKIDLCNNNKANSWQNLLENKPQINADERRFISNELVRTPYELTPPEFVSVCFSSLFFLGSFMNLNSWPTMWFFHDFYIN
jgi:hypothetical protein